MRAVILCPGPSLAAYGGGDNDALLIGVNRAATKHACDVWACADPGLFLAERCRVLGLPALLTSTTTADLSSDWPRPVKLIESALLRSFCPLPLWQTFTATAALVYAASLGARSIDVIGADWEGTEDWDHCSLRPRTPPAGNRSEERWKLEREIWENLLVPWLAARGITVNRHQDHAWNVERGA